MVCATVWVASDGPFGTSYLYGYVDVRMSIRFVHEHTGYLVSVFPLVYQEIT